MFLSTVRRYSSIYGKVKIKPIHVNHDFHKVIKLVRPEFLKPWHPQRSCDLRPLDKIDPNALKLEFRPFADVLDKLPEHQRKLFTVGYGHRRDGVGVIMEDTVSLVREHQYDTFSLEFKIAKCTVQIRNYQETFVLFPIQIRKSGSHRKRCKELIEKRKKYMKWLRANDYKKFEWLIELLGILYKSDPPSVRLERKASINVLVNMFCNEIRDKRMNEYKKMLESEKIPFLKMKLETLNKIKADEESINIECSVDEDIHQTIEMLDKLEKNEHAGINPVGSQNQISSS